MEKTIYMLKQHYQSPFVYMRMSRVNGGMGDFIVFFPIWLTSLILFAAIPTQRSEWPQFRARIVVLFVGKKFLGDLVRRSVKIPS